MPQETEEIVIDIKNGLNLHIFSYIHTLPLTLIYVVLVSYLTSLMASLNNPVEKASLFIGFYLICSIITSCTFSIMIHDLNQKNSPLKIALVTCFKKIHKIISASCILLFILMILASMVSLAFYFAETELFVHSEASKISQQQLSLPTILIAMCFSLIAIYISIKYIFFMPLILIHNCSILESFSISAKLTTNHWWEIFFVITLSYIISSLVRLVLVLVLGELSASMFTSLLTFTLIPSMVVILIDKFTPKLK